MIRTLLRGSFCSPNVTCWWSLNDFPIKWRCIEMEIRFTSPFSVEYFKHVRSHNEGNRYGRNPQDRPCPYCGKVLKPPSFANHKRECQVCSISHQYCSYHYFYFKYITTYWIVRTSCINWFFWEYGKETFFDRGNTMPDGRLLACFLLERVTYDKGTQKLGVGEHTWGPSREDKRATIFNVGSANTRRSVNQHSVSMSPGSTVGPRTSYARSKWAEVRGSVFVVKVSSVSATWTSTSVPNTSPIPSNVMFVGRPQGTSTLSTTTRGFATTLPSRNTTTLSRGLGSECPQTHKKIIFISLVQASWK